MVFAELAELDIGRDAVLEFNATAKDFTAFGDMSTGRLPTLLSTFALDPPPLGGGRGFGLELPAASAAAAALPPDAGGCSGTFHSHFVGVERVSAKESLSFATDERGEAATDLRVFGLSCESPPPLERASSVAVVRPPAGESADSNELIPDVGNGGDITFASS